MTIGERLKQLRLERGYDQYYVWDKISIEQSTLSNYENDRRTPKIDILEKFADLYGVSVDYLIGREDNSIDKILASKNQSRYMVPVLGRVQAGIPIEAVEEILDYEEISADMAARGEYFALSVRGASMEPRMREGDVVIVRQQEEVENGETAIVLVNGCDATIKKIGFSKEGIILIPTNPVFETKFYSNQEIKDLPVRILGKVVELRAKF